MANNKAKVIDTLRAMAKLISADRLRLEHTEYAQMLLSQLLRSCAGMVTFSCTMTNKFQPGNERCMLWQV